MIGVVYAVKETASHGPAVSALAAGLLGATALYLFVRRQLTLPKPLLDMRLFRSRGFSGAVLADLLTVLGLSGLVFFLSQYLQLVQGRRPFEAGLAELPAAIGAVAAGLIVYRTARRFSVRSVVAGAWRPSAWPWPPSPSSASRPATRCSARRCWWSARARASRSR